MQQYKVVADYLVEERKANRRWPTLMLMTGVVAVAGAALWYFRSGKSTAAPTSGVSAAAAAAAIRPAPSG